MPSAADRPGGGPASAVPAGGSPDGGGPAAGDEAAAAVPPSAAGPRRPRPIDRAIALFEVVLCSDYPTQLGIAVILDVLGFRPYTSAGRLSLPYVAILSIADAAVLVGLILLILRLHGERPRRVLLGTRPLGREALFGVVIMAVAVALGMMMLVLIQWLAPALHNVAKNPLEGLIRTPLDAVLFGLVTFIAGGFREEIQRAFILTRFEQSLGGATLGIVLSSIAFGSGHYLQGWDAMLTTAVLGAFWGIIYLRRRSVVAPIVSHAGFDLIEIMQYALLHH